MFVRARDRQDNCLHINMYHLTNTVAPSFNLMSPQTPGLQRLRHGPSIRLTASKGSLSRKFKTSMSSSCEGSEATPVGYDRRGALVRSASALSALILPFPTPSSAIAGSAFEMYTDDIDKYSLSIPAGWTGGVGSASGSVGTRRVVAFLPPGGNGETNVNIVATNTAADFTKMGSFGSAYDFGFRLVGSLDRSWVGKKPKFLGGTGKGDAGGQISKLIDAKESGGMYYIEYTVTLPGEFDRHLLSVVGLQFDGTYNRLYTVTAQADEADFKDLKSTLTSVVNSFKLPKV